MNINILGERLYRIRQLAGVSRQEIEKKYNISANTIKSWECGINETGIVKLVHYLKIFEVHYNIHIDMNSFLDLNTDNYFDKAMLNNEYLPSCYSSESNSFLQKKFNSDQQLIDNVVSNISNTIQEDQEYMLQGLFNSLSLNIMFKDEDNNIVRINKQAAADFNGNISDFEKKNTYDLFPILGKKYHDDDLAVLRTGESKIIIEEIAPLNSTPKLVYTKKTPIFSNDNKPLILIVFKDYEAEMAM